MSLKRGFAIAGLASALSSSVVHSVENYVAVAEELKGSCFMRNEKRTMGHELHAGDNLQPSDEVQCAPGAYVAIRYFDSRVRTYLVADWQPVGNTAGRPRPTSASAPMMGRHAYNDRRSAEMAAVTVPALRDMQARISSPTVLRPLPLFESIGDTDPSFILDGDDFPWKIIGNSGRYVRVEADGKVGWVDGCMGINPSESWRSMMSASSARGASQPNERAVVCD